jgi:hypothetical protein
MKKFIWHVGTLFIINAQKEAALCHLVLPNEMALTSGFTVGYRK